MTLALTVGTCGNSPNLPKPPCNVCEMGWSRPLPDHSRGCWLPAAGGGRCPCRQLEVGLELWEEAAWTLLCPGFRAQAWPGLSAWVIPTCGAQLLTHTGVLRLTQNGRHVPGLGQRCRVCLYSHLPCIGPTRWDWDSQAHFTDEEVKVTQPQLAAQSEACALSLGSLGGTDRCCFEDGCPSLDLGGQAWLGPLGGFSAGRISRACFCP